MVNVGYLHTQIGDPFGLGRTDLTVKELAISRERRKDYVYFPCLYSFIFLDS